MLQRNVSVYANLGWQDTGVYLTPGDVVVTLQYVSGEWTGGIGTDRWYDGRGDLIASYKCAEHASACKEPMPNVYNGALIGRVGDRLFEVGNYLQVAANASGNLFLRMNDHDEGLFDNDGAIAVQITLQQSPEPLAAPSPEVAAEKAIVNVYVMIFDPEVNGQPLTQNKGFADPHPLMDTYIKDVESVSGGSVVYRIAKESVIKTFPAKIDGFVFTGEQYWACVGSSAESVPEYCRRAVDYSAVLNTRYDPDYVSACEAIANHGVDEVWEWEGGWFGFKEFNIITPYSLCPELGKEFTFMTFNYSRGVTQAIESQAHRVENVLQRKLGLQVWDQFDGQRQRYAQDYDQPLAPDAGHPEVDPANTHCGNVHFPPNAYRHYQYDRDLPVQSDCDGWLNYPNVGGSKTTVNCEAWGCNDYGFLKWWLSHIPHKPGVSNGIYHNWWKYVFAFN